MSVASSDVVFTAEDLGCRASTVLLVKNCADVLERHYPGWKWAVTPQEKQGVLDIHSLRISGKWAYTLHLAKIQNDPTLRAVVNAGGAVLERFGFRRVPYSYAEWRRREQVAGMFIPDVSDLSRYERRRAKVDQIRGELASGRARIVTDASIGRALQEARIRA